MRGDEAPSFSLNCRSVERGRLADESNTFPPTHSFFHQHHGCRLPVWRRDSPSRSNPSKSAAESLHVPSFSALRCSIHWLGTNYGIPLIGCSITGRTERAQEYSTLGNRPAARSSRRIASTSGGGWRPSAVVGPAAELRNRRKAETLKHTQNPLAFTQT